MGVCEDASFYIRLGAVVRSIVIRGVANEVSTVMAGAGVGADTGGLGEIAREH